MLGILTKYKSDRTISKYRKNDLTKENFEKNYLFDMTYFGDFITENVNMF